jgi:hypothetical protein
VLRSLGHGARNHIWIPDTRGLGQAGPPAGLGTWRRRERGGGQAAARFGCIFLLNSQIPVLLFQGLWFFQLGISGGPRARAPPLPVAHRGHGGLRETACTGGRGVWSGTAWYRWRRFGGGGFISPAGKLLTGNIGSLCEQQPLKALRASRS